MLWEKFGVDKYYFETQITYPEYIKMTAAALDIEELEYYKEYILAGGEAKKFKWSSPDRAGTKPYGGSSKALGLSPFIMKLAESGAVHKSADGAFSIAKAQGRRVVYVDSAGQAWDEAGNKTKRTMDDFPLPITLRSNG